DLIDVGGELLHLVGNEPLDLPDMKDAPKRTLSRTVHGLRARELLVELADGVDREDAAVDEELARLFDSLRVVRSKLLERLIDLLPELLGVDAARLDELPATADAVHIAHRVFHQRARPFGDASGQGHADRDRPAAIDHLHVAFDRVPIAKLDEVVREARFGLPAGVELDVDDLLLENPRRSRSRLEPNRVVARVEHEPSLNEAALELDAIESVRRFRFRFPACAGVVARFGRAFLGGHARRRDEDRAQSPRERDESREYASKRQR